MLFSLLHTLILGAAGSPVSQLRQRQSVVPVGVVIESCTVPGTFGLTFDDGPYIYTEEVLNTLAANGIKATFFVNGQNYDSIYDYTSTIQRMISDGHQVGSHTWDHADLTTLSVAGITSEMTQLETAFTTILGKIPTYMRPPYFATNSLVLQTLANLGYHVIQASIDTLDWENDTPDTIGQSAVNFQQGLDAGGTISLEHDVYQTTAETLLPQLIAKIKAKGLTAVPVGQCLGDPAANWYRAPGSTPPPPPSGGNPSPDDTCGGSNGYTCVDSLCCSQWGWCGSTPDYCAAGCQPAFGICS